MGSPRSRFVTGEGFSYLGRTYRLKLIDPSGAPEPPLRLQHGRFLLLRGRPFVLIDANAPIRGLLGKYFQGRMPKYFKGPDRPRLGDLAYTETAMFGM